MKHGFTKSILQSDAETALMQFVNTVSTDRKLPTRVSPPYSHQSQRRWKGSTGTSLTNFAQQGYNGAKTSTLNHICCLQSVFLGHFNTASSSSTTTSNPHQAKHPTSRTTATTIALTSLPLVRLSLETFATSRLKSYVAGINIKSSEASGLDVTSSRMSTSLHYLCSTANILPLQQMLTDADKSLVYLVKKSMTSTS